METSLSSSSSPHHRIVSLPGKGEGLVATRDIAAGTLIVEEAPVVVLDPPTKRKELLMLLGCRLFSTIDMRTTPDNIRSQINRMILDKQFDKLGNSEREWVFTLFDRTADAADSGRNGHRQARKTIWGIWQTNSIPLGSYRASGIFRTVTKINHSCRPNAHHLWCAETGREQVWVVEPIKAGQEITISYIRTFCSKKFRQSLLNDRFGFVCDCQACSLAGRALDKDDWCRTEIDKLAQKFAQSRQSNENPLETADIGETIIALMEEAGYNSSVLWPGYFNCFELYLLAGDCGKARSYADRAYELVCLAKGSWSADARAMLKYKDSPELYLDEFKASDQHFTSGLTHC